MRQFGIMGSLFVVALIPGFFCRPWGASRPRRRGAVADSGGDHPVMLTKRAAPR
jgi:hypothetical protein